MDGTRHVLCITRLKLVSLDPTDGKVRFEFPFGQRGATVNGASPVVVKGHVLATASYGIVVPFPHQRLASRSTRVFAKHAETVVW